MLLAGDIGGTKTKLAVFSPERGAQHPLAEARFSSADYPALRAIVCEFLVDTDVRISSASFGVAGPVVAGEAKVTNLPWVIVERELSTVLGGIPVRLINDLEAIASYVPFAPASARHTLNVGRPMEHGPLAVIAPGTGLGEAFLVSDGHMYHTYASEGGHVDFAPTTPLQLELLRYLQQRHGHVSYERVCSGRGIPNLYAYFRDNGLYVEPAELRAELAVATDRAPIIVQAAIEEIAVACECGGADALTAVNTVLGMQVDWRTGHPGLNTVVGGYSGTGIKPIALRCAFECVKAVRIPVIGCGGIVTVDDVLEFLSVGCTAVQVGTASFGDPGLLDRLAGALEGRLEEAGFSSISEVIGNLDVPELRRREAPERTP